MPFRKLALQKELKIDARVVTVLGKTQISGAVLPFSHPLAEEAVASIERVRKNARSARIELAGSLAPNGKRNDRPAMLAAVCARVGGDKGSPRVSSHVARKVASGSAASALLAAATAFLTASAAELAARSAAALPRALTACATDSAAETAKTTAEPAVMKAAEAAKAVDATSATAALTRSSFARPYFAATHAPVVERMRRAGAVLEVGGGRSY